MFPTTALSLGNLAAAVTMTPTEQRIWNLLTDDNLQEISSLEMNQIASFTYHENSMMTADQDMSDRIFQMLGSILGKPLNYSVLTMHKAISVTKHVLLYGAEKAVTSAVAVGRHVDALQQYNTAILAQQQTGAVGFLYRLKGGTVDQGGPVRQVAAEVQRLLADPAHLRQERSNKADPNSLVPIGSQRQVVFVSDAVRLQNLQRCMDEQRMQQTRSNLAKASDGFGSGYNAADGKMVVGAAHGLDEMLKMAELEKQKFSETGNPAAGAASYRPPTNFGSAEDYGVYHYRPQPQQRSTPAASATSDLLSWDGGHTTTTTSDLLDLAPSAGVENPIISSTSADLMGLGASLADGTLLGNNHGPVDPFGLVDLVSPTATTTSTGSSSVMWTAGMAGFSPLPSTTTISPPAVSATETKPSIMGGPPSRMDRFLALDDLNPLGHMKNANSPFAGLSAIGSSSTRSSSNNLSSNPPVHAMALPNPGPVIGPALGSSGLSHLHSLSAMPLAGPQHSGMQQQQPQQHLVSSSSSYSTVPFQVNTSSLRVSAGLTPPYHHSSDGITTTGMNDDDKISAYAMGGMAGSGLHDPPVAPPAAPPPPPMEAPPLPTTAAAATSQNAYLWNASQGASSSAAMGGSFPYY